MDVDISSPFTPFGPFLRQIFPYHMPEVKTTPGYILLGLGYNLFTLSIIYSLDTLDCIFCSKEYSYFTYFTWWHIDFLILMWNHSSPKFELSVTR
jgi:hypothetical protein